MLWLQLLHLHAEQSSSNWQAETFKEDFEHCSHASEGSNFLEAISLEYQDEMFGKPLFWSDNLLADEKPGHCVRNVENKVLFRSIDY
jgi:hypothetical protein